MRGQRTGKHVSDRTLGRSASWQSPGRIHRPAARCRRERRVDRPPAAARRHRDLLPGDSPLKIHSPMKHLRPIFSFLFPIFCFLLSLPVAAQSLSQDLARFAETPAVPGYEQTLAAEIRAQIDRKSTRLNSSHVRISYAVFCLQKKFTSCTASEEAQQLSSTSTR